MTRAFCSGLLGTLMKNLIGTAGTVACLLVAGQSVSWAQEAYTTTSAPALVVRLSVVAAPGVPAKVVLRNGQMGRWTMADGSVYGLTPLVDDRGSQLFIFQITPGTTPGTERIQQLSKLPLALDTSASYPESTPLFEVTLLGTSPIPAKAPMTPRAEKTSKAPAPAVPR